MAASQESVYGTAPAILLVEEYGALAAALTCAFKKFAPKHQAHVVQSLNDAKTTAAEIHPKLLILDFDPPLPKAIEFLERLRISHPATGVLVLTSGIPREFSRLRGGPSAVQFVEKPFELAELGAAVQGIVGPLTSGDSRGTLRDLNLKDLVPLECVSNATVMLQVTAGRQSGEIHFVQGQISHASAVGLTGIEAFEEIMRWTNARVAEVERPDNAPRTIHGRWTDVFFQAIDAAKHQVDPSIISAAPVAAVQELKAPQEGKKILVIDDTEMLLVFVEDTLSMVDSTFEISTALSAHEGLQQAETLMPDLVLLDYSLSDLHGDQVCERLLQNKPTSRIPVVMMSGHVPEMMATANRFRNVVATIAKPFLSSALVQLVSDALAKGPLPPTTESKSLSPVKVETFEQGAIASPHASTRGTKGTSSRSSTKPAPATGSAELEIGRTTTEVVQPTPTSKGPQSTGSQEIIVKPALVAPAPQRIAGSNGTTVVIEWGMELTSVEITPRFRVGTIHAKPFVRTLSLTRLHPSNQNDYRCAPFELASVDVDSNGQISMMRVRPAQAPTGSIRTHNGLAIDDVKLLNGTACIQLTGRSSAPMLMQLSARFRVVGVQLSDRFEVAQLILESEGSRVQISFESQRPGKAGAEFETRHVDVESANTITEMVLNPAL